MLSQSEKTLIVINYTHTFIGSIFTSTPQKIEIALGESDVKSIDFLALKLSGDIALSGIVNFDEEKTE